jgi:hypothetical protein
MGFIVVLDTVARYCCPPCPLFNRYGGNLPGVKKLGREHNI